MANLVLEVLIVVTGGLVRLTGSGLGCPTWPQCVPGSYVPVREQAEGFHRYIEFGNRTLTGAVASLRCWCCMPCGSGRGTVETSSSRRGPCWVGCSPRRSSAGSPCGPG